MLKTRVMTALVLLAILLPVLFLHNLVLFAAVVVVFFAAAAWEGLQLFGSRQPVLWTAFWVALVIFVIFISGLPGVRNLFIFCVALWAIRFVPALRFGLPALGSSENQLLCGTYLVSVAGCFIAIVILFEHSPLYLLSVMGIVWVADIGAYFAGKSFGSHKLAPAISPGKSWEGAIGGWLAVLLIAAGVAMGFVGDTFEYKLLQRGWPAFIGTMTLLVAASIVGDLFESQLKRRTGIKDSSNLLPGHGGVLDRIDALIPVLPLAALIDLWL